MPVPVVLLDGEWKQKYIDQCQAFIGQYQHSKIRYNFLIIVGDSRTGKSQFAEHALGFKSPFVCEGGFVLNAYDSVGYDAIIFGDVPDITDKIVRYKALFQANNKTTFVGESNTNMYAVAVNTHRIPIVITLNKEAEWDKVSRGVGGGRGARTKFDAT